MIDAVILDTTPLGITTGRQDKIETQAIRNWAMSLALRGCKLYVPEIADYEVRRELIRAGKLAGLVRLDLFVNTSEFIPISTSIMRNAAEIWADARNQGIATADVQALDGDVIVVAQSISLNLDRSRFVVATENVAHL